MRRPPFAHFKLVTSIAAVALGGCTNPQPTRSAAALTAADRNCVITYEDGGQSKSIERRVTFSSTPTVVPVTFAGGGGFTVTLGTSDSTDVHAIAAGNAVPGVFAYARITDGITPAEVVVTELSASSWSMPWGGAKGLTSLTCSDPAAATGTPAVAPYACSASRWSESGALLGRVSIDLAAEDRSFHMYGPGFYGLFSNDEEVFIEVSNTFYTSAAGVGFRNGIGVYKVLSWVPSVPAFDELPPQPGLYLEGGCTRLPSSGGTFTGGGEYFGEGADARAIPDGAMNGFTSTFDGNSIEGWAPFATTSKIQVGVQITHARPDDLDLFLSHGGRTVALGGGQRVANYGRYYDTFEVPQLAGADVPGPWTLRVVDRRSGEAGAIEGWTLFMGRPDPGITVPRTLEERVDQQIPSDHVLETSIMITDDKLVSSLALEIDVATTPINTLEFSLTNGRQTAHLGYIGGEVKFQERFQLVDVAGLDLHGKWTLRIRDRQSGRSGRLRSWRLLLNG